MQENITRPKPLRVHLVGVCGTGMAPLAGLLTELGHQVSGSDTSFLPPMDNMLERAGVKRMQGFDAAHISNDLDCVVVGNVCRPDNPEAQAALLTPGVACLSMPGALQQFIIADRRVVVVAGTHGKTTTSAMVAYLLEAAGLAPGYLIGGLPMGASASYALGNRKGWFVIEGDEYDSAFFEKRPKLWSYQAEAAVLTSIEHDHLDIYPTQEKYRKVFEHFIEALPACGHLAAYLGDPLVRDVVRKASCAVHGYALQHDATGEQEAEWLATEGPHSGCERAYEVFLAGTLGGRGTLQLSGSHNLRNALGALSVTAHACAVSVSDSMEQLGRFRGVARRQELLAHAGQAYLYRDFAHHPTAVAETLRGFRARHQEARLVAAFEPRSATSSRSVHQKQYASAFDAADEVLIAPIGKSNVPHTERLDVERLATDIQGRGNEASAFASLDDLESTLAAKVGANSVVVLMSNGSFGGLPERLASALRARSSAPR